MGAFVNGPVTRLVGWTVTLIIITLNLKLLFDMFAPDALQHAVYGLLTL
jgi:Mn2+/Fe2+ NRAMP family transporter